jgi:hypothetical protein
MPSIGLVCSRDSSRHTRLRPAQGRGLARKPVCPYARAARLGGRVERLQQSPYPAHVTRTRCDEARRWCSRLRGQGRRTMWSIAHEMFRAGQCRRITTDRVDRHEGASDLRRSQGCSWIETCFQMTEDRRSENGASQAWPDMKTKELAARLSATRRGEGSRP